MALYQAMVKSVLSGDTVVLHNVNNPKQERVLSLAFVSAPRIRREGDEVGSTLPGPLVWHCTADGYQQRGLSCGCN